MSRFRLIVVGIVLVGVAFTSYHFLSNPVTIKKSKTTRGQQQIRSSDNSRKRNSQTGRLMPNSRFGNSFENNGGNSFDDRYGKKSQFGDQKPFNDRFGQPQNQNLPTDFDKAGGRVDVFRSQKTTKSPNLFSNIGRKNELNVQGVDQTKDTNAWPKLPADSKVKTPNTWSEVPVGAKLQTTMTSLMNQGNNRKSNNAVIPGVVGMTPSITRAVTSTLLRSGTTTSPSKIGRLDQFSSTSKWNLTRSSAGGIRKKNGTQTYSNNDVMTGGQKNDYQKWPQQGMGSRKNPGDQLTLQRLGNNMNKFGQAKQLMTGNQESLKLKNYQQFRRAQDSGTGQRWQQGIGQQEGYQQRQGAVDFKSQQVLRMSNQVQPLGAGSAVSGQQQGQPGGFQNRGMQSQIRALQQQVDRFKSNQQSGGQNVGAQKLNSQIGGQQQPRARSYLNRGQETGSQNVGLQSKLSSQIGGQQTQNLGLQSKLSSQTGGQQTQNLGLQSKLSSQTGGQQQTGLYRGNSQDIQNRGPLLAQNGQLQRIGQRSMSQNDQRGQMEQNRLKMNIP